MKEWTGSGKGRAVVCLFFLTLLLLFCAGCEKQTINPNEKNSETTGGEAAEDKTESAGGSTDTGASSVSASEYTAASAMPVQPQDLIDTYHVVLVIDASASTLRTDPDRSALEASCMFLDSLYTGVSEGTVHADVDIITYHDTVSYASDYMRSLTSAATAEDFKNFIRRTEIPADSGDSALGQALYDAVNMLSQHSGGTSDASRRSIVMLFTDGYTHSAASRAAASSKSQTSMEDTLLPQIGGENQPRLETALKYAKQYQYEMFVLMLNPMESRDLIWGELKQIANYTQRPLSDWEETSSAQSPQVSVLPQPITRKAGLFGGGIFPDKQFPGRLCNYYTAKSAVQIQAFYVQMAAVMLQGSAVSPITSTRESLENPENDQSGRFNRYDMEIPKQSGISAAVFYILSTDGVSAVRLRGPDPDHPALTKDYGVEFYPRRETGWEENQTIRHDWYGYQDTGEGKSVFAALTVLNPAGGTWQFLARGAENQDQSLLAYALLVSGAEAEILFQQGTDPDSRTRPVTGGDMMVRFQDQDGPLPESFYQSMDVKECIVTPAAGEAVRIALLPAKDQSGNAMLIGHYDAPYPGTYAVEFRLISNPINYSRSASVVFQATTDKKISIEKIGKEGVLSPPYLAGEWAELENSGRLHLTLEDNQWEMDHPDFATIRRDGPDLIIHAMQSGEAALTIHVTTQSGETWSLKYPVIVK